MNTKMQNVKIASTITGNELTITFRQAVPKGEKFDAEKHDTYYSATFDSSILEQAIIKQAVMHGLKQKLVDNLAFTKEDKLVKTVKDAADMTEALWAQLKDGHWNAPTRSGSKKAPNITLSDMEKKFLAGVEAGITTFEAAAELYKMATGLELPKPVTVEDTEDDDNTENDNDNTED